MYKEDLVLDNQKWLICHKTKPNQTKPRQKWTMNKILIFFKILGIQQNYSSKFTIGLSISENGMKLFLLMISTATNLNFQFKKAEKDTPLYV